MSRRMTREERWWLLGNLPRFTSWADVLAAFRERYGWTPFYATAVCFASQHGVKLGRTCVKWSEHSEYDAWLRENVPGHSANEIIDMFKERFGVSLTMWSLKNRETKLGVRQGTVGGQFAPGLIPWNKGRKAHAYCSPEAIANMARTQFKRGQESHNTVKDGTERVGRDGYIEVKVPPEIAETGRTHPRWIAKQRLIWEREHGRKLERGESVMFADGDKRNFDPANLVMVTQAQRLYINKNGIPYHDAEGLRTACAAADLAAGIMRAELRPRTCAECGRTFTPGFKRQRRCRACIDKSRGGRR